MKNEFLIKLGVGTAFAWLVLAPITSFAQFDGGLDENRIKTLVNEELIAMEDLGIETPGLLETNPFYFLKNFRRSTLRTFYFNPLKRAEFELDVLNERAAEINLLAEIGPDNIEALNAALGSYGDTVSRLKSNLNGVKDKTRNTGIDKFLNALSDRAYKHLWLFNQLKNKTDFAVREKFNNSEAILAGAAADAWNRWDSSESLRPRMAAVLENHKGGAFREFLAAETLMRLEEAPASDSDLRGVLLGMKEDLFLRMQIKAVPENLGALLPEVAGFLPGDASDKIKVLDEAREAVSDSDLRNALAAVRQSLLDSASKSREISRPESEKLIAETKKLADLLELKSAEFNLKQAKESFAAAQYVSAFGQASLASAAAKNALTQLWQKNNLGAEVKNLKSKYDSLIVAASVNGLNKENAAELFESLANAEKSLVKVSDLEAKGAKLESAVQALKEAKLLLLQSEYLLNNLLAQLEAQKPAQPLLQKVLNQ